MVIPFRHEAPGDATCHDVVEMTALSAAIISSILVYDTLALSRFRTMRTAP